MGKLVSLAKAAELLGIGEFRMRKLLIEGRVVGRKVKVAEDFGVERWMVDVEEVMKYKGERNVKESRQWICKVGTGVEEKFLEFCRKEGIEVEKRFVYKKK